MRAPTLTEGFLTRRPPMTPQEREMKDKARVQRKQEYRKMYGMEIRKMLMRTVGAMTAATGVALVLFLSMKFGRSYAKKWVKDVFGPWAEKFVDKIGKAAKEGATDVMQQHGDEFGKGFARGMEDAWSRTLQKGLSKTGFDLIRELKMAGLVWSGYTIDKLGEMADTELSELKQGIASLSKQDLSDLITQATKSGGDVLTQIQKQLPFFLKAKGMR